MSVRRSVVAGSFYPGDEPGCREFIERLLPSSVTGPSGEALAGIVPHAGWVFSGSTAGKVFAWLRSRRDTLRCMVLLGSDHTGMAVCPSLWPDGSWQTPLGAADVDEELASALLEEMGPLVAADPRCHEREHSIEVQVPFVQYLFPGCKILPVAVPPSERSIEFGQSLGGILERYGDVALVGTSDLTHYGKSYGFAPKGEGERAHSWVKEENDRGLVRLLLEMKAGEILPEASEHRNACGAGALAATVAYARSMGVEEGVLLEQTTSHEVHPQGPPSMFVGYAAVAYGK